MTVLYGNLNPPAAGGYAGADGDIFVRTSGVNPQWRFSSTPSPVWTPIVPPAAGQPRTTTSDTRGDVLPRGGDLNDRLAKIGAPARAWDVAWANAASGVVSAAIDHPASPVWIITHELTSRFVNVTVISPGSSDPDAEQTIHFPQVDYIALQACRLTFAEPVAGTAIVRR